MTTTPTGRRAAKQAEIAARPARILEMLSAKPMLNIEIRKALGMGERRVLGRLLSVMKREGLVTFVIIGRDDWYWVACGSQAEADAIDRREIAKAESERARRERGNERMKMLHAREARAQQRKARIERDLEEWLTPKHVVTAFGEWQVQVPRGAVRSVFDMA